MSARKSPNSQQSQEASKAEKPTMAKGLTGIPVLGISD